MTSARGVQDCVRSVPAILRRSVTTAPDGHHPRFFSRHRQLSIAGGMSSAIQPTVARAASSRLESRAADRLYSPSYRRSRWRSSRRCDSWSRGSRQSRRSCQPEFSIARDADEILHAGHSNAVNNLWLNRAREFDRERAWRNRPSKSPGRSGCVWRRRCN